MVSLYSLPSFFLSFSFVLLSPFSNFVDAQTHDYNSTTTLSTRWTNNATTSHFPQYEDESIVQAILFRGKETLGLAFACGFYCNGNCNSYLLAVSFVRLNSSGLIDPYSTPQVLWSANRNNPVNINSTLELTSEGDLVLKDADGSVAWSTNTSGKSVVGLNLTDLGNLVLFDKDNGTVWQSFDQPTDSLVLGQKLRQGQRLTASVSKTNWTDDDMISLSLNGDVFRAQVETNPPQIYFERKPQYNKTWIEAPYKVTPRGQSYYYRHRNPYDWNASIEYVEFVNGRLSSSLDLPWESLLIQIPQASSMQYMKLGSDGHLRVYEFAQFDQFDQWKEVADLFKDYLSDCDYPTVCGRYGFCSDGQCSCLASSEGTNYFQQVDDKEPNLGCYENVPLSCGASKNQSLLELKNVMYFSFTPDLNDITVSSCKEACAKNYSCKAAIFQNESNYTNGNCYLQTQVFSLRYVDKKIVFDNFTTYLKVQNVANEALYTPIDNRMSNRLPLILGSSLGAFFTMMIFIVAIVLFVQKRDDNQAE